MRQGQLGPVRSRCPGELVERPPPPVAGKSSERHLLFKEKAAGRKAQGEGIPCFTVWGGD